MGAIVGGVEGGLGVLDGVVNVILCEGWQVIHRHPCGICLCWRTPEQRIL